MCINTGCQFNLNFVQIVYQAGDLNQEYANQKLHHQNSASYTYKYNY